MKTTDILCASDLSAASLRAVGSAAGIARRLSCPVKVLHVLEHDTPEAREQAMASLGIQIQQSGGNGRMEPLLLAGDPLSTIASESQNGHGLLVLATHGLRGLRQKLFGADILKLVRKVGVPSFVVQEDGRFSLETGPIVMPVAAHEDILRLIEAVIMLALAHDSEVHIYHLHRTGEEASEELLRNKQFMLEKLTDAGLRVKEVNEPSRSASISFAGPTLEYATRSEASCIAMMCHASREYRYMADAEKERLLINEQHIPILCC